MTPWRRWLPVVGALAAALAAAALTAPAARGQTISCDGAATLEELMLCIRSHMPRAGSVGFQPPQPAAQAEWGAAVGQFLRQEGGELPLPPELAGVYSAFKFVDAGTGRGYFVLMEIGDANGDGVVDRGWGTYIYNPGAANELHVQIPHPLFDLRTDRQGLGVFKGTDARSFQMAGAHRYSNTAASPCQPPYPNSDPAHNEASMFTPATEALLDFYGPAGPFLVLQFHGMAVTSCPGADVFITYGTGWLAALHGPLARLRQALAADHPDWVIVVPGDALACHLDGGNNVQARRINGVPAGSTCGQAADEYSGRFIHVEQKIDFRAPADWTRAVQAAAPVNPPAVPALSSPAAVASLLALFSFALRPRRR